MLDEAPETLIYSAIEGFETQPDVDSIGRINDYGHRVNESWQETEKRLQNTVSTLENELNEVLSETERMKQPKSELLELLNLSKRSEDVYTSENIGNMDSLSLLTEETALLDRQKFSLAKQISDIESSVAKLKATADKLAQNEAEIEDQRGVALASNVASNMNSDTMKILLFKKFGIHIEEGGTDANDKIMIFSENKKNPAKVLEVDPKFSDYFISNYIWDHLGNSSDN